MHFWPKVDKADPMAQRMTPVKPSKGLAWGQPGSWDRVATGCELVVATGYEPFEVPGDSRSAWQGTR